MNLAKLINTLGGAENPFDRMSGRMPNSEASVWQSKILRPLRKRHGLAIARKPYIVAFIYALNFAARPLAIFLAVVAVIVEALKGHAFRWQSHVSKKVLELVPALANLDAALAVIRKTLDVWIATSIQHGAPVSIDRRAAHSMGLRERSASLLELLEKAPARGCFAISEFSRNNSSDVSTNAFAKPFCWDLPATRDLADGSKPSEYFATEYLLFHDLDYIGSYAGSTT